MSVILMCCALRVYVSVWTCGVYWLVSQLSMYEMLVACIAIVLSYFEFPWIIIFLEVAMFLSLSFVIVY